MKVVGKGPFINLLSTKRVLDKLSPSEKFKPILMHTNKSFGKNFSGTRNSNQDKINYLEDKVIKLKQKRRQGAEEQEVYSYKLPKEIGNAVENIPISALKLQLQMEMPSVDKLFEKYDVNKEHHSSTTEIRNPGISQNTKVPRNMLTDVTKKKDNPLRVMNNNFMLPLDFKAEINGVLGLNMKELTSESVKTLRSIDLNNLISAITGNIASVAFQRTCDSAKEIMHDRRSYSTAAKPLEVDPIIAKPLGDKNGKARISPSELFQTYKTKLKKRPYLQKQQESKEDPFGSPTNSGEVIKLTSIASPSGSQGAGTTKYRSRRAIKGLIASSLGSEKDQKFHSERTRPIDSFSATTDSKSSSKVIKGSTMPVNTSKLDKSNTSNNSQQNFLSRICKMDNSTTSKEDNAYVAYKNKEIETNDGKKAKLKLDCSKLHTSDDKGDLGRPKADCSLVFHSSGDSSDSGNPAAPCSSSGHKPSSEARLDCNDGPKKKDDSTIQNFLW